jgi:hypothetical protein
MAVIRTVGEMIEALKQYTPDTLILSPWRGTSLYENIIEVTSSGKAYEKPTTDTVKEIRYVIIE